MRYSSNDLKYISLKESKMTYEASKENLKFDFKRSMTTNDSANPAMLGDSLANKRKLQRKIHSFGGDSRGSTQSKKGDVVSPKSRLAPTVDQIDPVD